ncbi:hypothetical protein [Herbaspirillum rubrisubalbicans]|uniref:hypothetical protein n=1 Tax=Herbaspirillum rubrisubalbicans TaxID=80842 RepID=UPI00209E2C5D|nr:hypothetical protein [Herbaspirillum rubrisubalbicans]
MFGKFASLHGMTPLFEIKSMPEFLFLSGTIYWGRVKETEGAWVNFAVGGAIGFGSYALANYVTNRPITWQGSLYSIGTGALTGGMGGALIRASGGGLAGQIAWRPNILASNFGASQYSRYRGW